MSEAFNLDREIACERMVDPLGKKWEIHGRKGSALVHARPNPDRADAQIPKEFSGEWTSPSVLKTKIEMWLNRQWDEAERAQQKSVRKAHAEKVEKKTAEQSLDELPDEIKEALGDIIEVEKPEPQAKKKAKKKVKNAGAKD